MTGTVSLKVWGEFALFTRPELKVERMSYPFITPLAARGVVTKGVRKTNTIFFQFLKLIGVMK